MEIAGQDRHRNHPGQPQRAPEPRPPQQPGERAGASGAPEGFGALQLRFAERIPWLLRELDGGFEPVGAAGKLPVDAGGGLTERVPVQKTEAGGEHSGRRAAVPGPLKEGGIEGQDGHRRRGQQQRQPAERRAGGERALEVPPEADDPQCV